MAKTIKFNLICDQKPIRTIEDLQNNFSIEDILAYYHNGLLTRWLEVRGYSEELEAVKEIEEKKSKSDIFTEMDLISDLIYIFDVEHDWETVEKCIYILEYKNKQKELQEGYKMNNFKKNQIISDYENGYNQLVKGLLENPCDMAYVKATINEIIENYPWVLELNHRDLFYSLVDTECILPIMCLLMREECRKYYLPIEVENENGETVYDITTDSDKSEMYQQICALISDRDKISRLREYDYLHTFAGVTDGYWKDLEPKGKKYMIIRMANGNFVRSAGNREEEYSAKDVTENFIIVDGIDYKSNNANHTLFYMEV